MLESILVISQALKVDLVNYSQNPPSTPSEWGYFTIHEYILSHWDPVSSFGKLSVAAVPVYIFRLKGLYFESYQDLAGTT